MSQNEILHTQHNVTKSYLCNYQLMIFWKNMTNACRKAEISAFSHLQKWAWACSLEFYIVYSPLSSIN